MRYWSPREDFDLFNKFYQSYKGSSGVNASLVTHSTQHSDEEFFLLDKTGTASK